MHQFVTETELLADEVPQGRNEWLSRMDITGGENLMLCRVHIPPGQGHGFHTHPELDEIIYVLSGVAEQWVDQEKRLLSPGQIAHIPKGTVHATFNASDQTLSILAIFSPGVHKGELLIDVSDQTPWCDLRPNGPTA